MVKPPGARSTERTRARIRPRSRGGRRPAAWPRPDPRTTRRAGRSRRAAGGPRRRGTCELGIAERSIRRYETTCSVRTGDENSRSSSAKRVPFRPMPGRRTRSSWRAQGSSGAGLDAGCGGIARTEGRPPRPAARRVRTTFELLPSTGRTRSLGSGSRALRASTGSPSSGPRHCGARTARCKSARRPRSRRAGRTGPRSRRGPAGPASSPVAGPTKPQIPMDRRGRRASSFPAADVHATPRPGIDRDRRGTPAQDSRVRRLPGRTCTADAMAGVLGRGRGAMHRDRPSQCARLCGPARRNASARGPTAPRRSARSVAQGGGDTASRDMPTRPRAAVPASRPRWRAAPRTPRELRVHRGARTSRRGGCPDCTTRAASRV